MQIYKVHKNRQSLGADVLSKTQNVSDIIGVYDIETE